MNRPTVPERFRSYKPPVGWANVFELAPETENLYGTDDLPGFGDWAGQTLILARDGCPASVIRACRDHGDRLPWRASKEGGGSRTNAWLMEHAQQLTGGILYGSACAHLLVDDGTSSYSTTLRGFSKAEGHLKEVLVWVLTEMPNVKRVVCLGSTAWYVTAAVLKPDEQRHFRQHRDAHTAVSGVLSGKEIAMHAVYHPAARVSENLKMACWGAMVAQTLS